MVSGCVLGAAVSNRRSRRLYSAMWLDLVNSEWEGASSGAVQPSVPSAVQRHMARSSE